MLTIKRSYKCYASLFNEFTSISVNLHEIEALKFYNLDEFDRNPNLHLVYVERETRLAMNAHEFINYEFDKK